MAASSHVDLPCRENIHSETYGLAMKALSKDDIDRNMLFYTVDAAPTMRAKAAWCHRWIVVAGDSNFGLRLVARAIFKGIFLSSSLAVFFWMKSRGLMPAMTRANRLIARDNGLHMSFACLLYRHLRERPPFHIVLYMLEDAVCLEQAFIRCGCDSPSWVLPLIPFGSLPPSSFAWNERGRDAGLRAVRRRLPSRGI